MPNVDLQTHKKVALVVDDSKVYCQILSALLKQEGYEVVTAYNGGRSVEKYAKYRPDLVLINVNIPVMNGFEAVLKLKQLNTYHAAPLIFITSDSSEQTFIDSIDAGAFDVLVQPFSTEIFKAKIKSVQRKSDLYRRVKVLQQEQDKDAQIAENLISGLIESKNVATDRITIVKQPAKVFSGDIHLSALAPNGDINILLGDFTGHGLRSTIGAIPLSETFRVMTSKGFSPIEIISQINRKLNKVLPTDLFLAAIFVSISYHNKIASFFNAGLPDAYIFDENAQIKHKIESCHPPLGILEDLIATSEVSVRDIKEDQRIVLISDGIVEAKNDEGENFDYSGFESAAIAGIKQGNLAQTLMQEINKFCQSTPQTHDISVIDIPCGGWEQASIKHPPLQVPDPKTADENHYEQTPAWACQLILSSERLKSINPIPMIMNQINAIEGEGPQWQSLYTIFTELFVNALDHGVLGLSSELKSSPEGFTRYFSERDKRLNQLVSGSINLALKYFTAKQGGKLIITVQDSGPGFDFTSAVEKLQSAKEQDTNAAYSGRGLQLVYELCDSLKFKENGTLVEAVYTWQ